MTSTSSAPTFQAFAETNKIENVDDQLFEYKMEEHEKQRKAKAWKDDVHYFKKVKMSALALIKIVMHAHSGGDLEVMGMMQGYIDGHTMVITDSFALPVEGTETRVNAGAEAFEYMVDYLNALKKVGRTENCLGWYHSHPGYKCWLSGIDVGTQAQQQKFQDPWLAVVVDPKVTMAQGRVEIGAFRTYPDDYSPEGTSMVTNMSLPKEKIEDFGVFASKYYPLDLSFFKSSVDTQMLNLLWNKYWVNTLSSTPLIKNRDYYEGNLKDLVENKLDSAENHLSHSGRYLFAKKKDEAPPMKQLLKDTASVSDEIIQATMNQVVKDVVFNPQRRTLQAAVKTAAAAATSSSS